MKQPQRSPDEVARVGREVYEREIRSRVMPQQKGKFLVLDIVSHDYEVADEDMDASDRLRARRPDGVFFGLRVGYTTAYTLAGTMTEEDA